MTVALETLIRTGVVGEGFYLVDPGVVNVTDLLAGPITLYTPAVGSLIRAVLMPDGYVVLDGGSGRIDILQGGFSSDGTFGPIAEPYTRFGEYEISAGDALADIHQNITAESQAIDVQTLALRAMPPATRHLGVLTGWSLWLRSGDPIQAWYLPGSDGYPFLTAPLAWAPAFPYAQYATIHGPDDHYWAASPGGISGLSIPDFASNEGGTVADGTGALVWTDEGAIPTQGSLHLQFLVGAA